MQIKIFRSTFARTVLIAALGAGALFASTSSAAVGGGVDKAAEALVPAAVKAKGTVLVAADASYAPNEFIASDGHTVIGMDADLAKAIFPLLGLKVSVVNVTFDAIIPDLSSGKYDVGMSSFTDTKAREKVVNFVDYFEAGTSFFEEASGGPKVTGLSSLCGLTVSVETGTTEQSDATGQAKKCPSAQEADGPRVPDAEWREPRDLQRQGPGQHGRLAGRRLPGQAVGRQVQAGGPAPTASRPTDRGAEGRRDLRPGDPGWR